MKRLLLAIPILAGLALSASGVFAHHGWSWTTGGNIDLIGIIKTVRLGNLHGVLQVDAEGDVWTVEVGQPWRNERAGLKDGDLAVGKEIRPRRHINAVSVNIVAINDHVADINTHAQFHMGGVVVVVLSWPIEPRVILAKGAANDPKGPHEEFSSGLAIRKKK